MIDLPLARRREPSPPRWRCLAPLRGEAQPASAQPASAPTACPPAADPARPRALPGRPAPGAGPWLSLAHRQGRPHLLPLRHDPRGAAGMDVSRPAHDDGARGAATCSPSSSTARPRRARSPRARRPMRAPTSALPAALAHAHRAAHGGRVRRLGAVARLRARVPDRVAGGDGGAPRGARPVVCDRPGARAHGRAISASRPPRSRRRRRRSPRCACRRRERRSSSSPAASTSSRPAAPGRCSRTWPTAWTDGNLAELEGYERWCDCLDTAAERASMKRLLDDRNPLLADGDRRAARRRQVGVRRRRQPAHDRPDAACRRCCASAATASSRSPSGADRARSAARSGDNRHDTQRRHDERRQRLRASSFPASISCRAWSRTPARRCPASASGSRRRSIRPSSTSASASCARSSTGSSRTRACWRRRSRRSRCSG